jgi:hypothetical protein
MAYQEYKFLHTREKLCGHSRQAKRLLFALEE